MDLLKTTTNQPYRDRNEEIEYLRDWCCLYIDDSMEWEFYINQEVDRGVSQLKLKQILRQLVQIKEKRRKNQDRERRLVIWTNNLTRLRVYIQLLDQDLIPEFRVQFNRGRKRKYVSIIHNKDLEFRSFDQLTGENFENTKETYSIKEKGVAAMVKYLQMKENQGFKGWNQIKHTQAYMSLKAFYKRFSEEEKKALRFEQLKRIPSYEVYQVLEGATKAGILFINLEKQNKLINNVYSHDISSAYNSQFIRGNDFPIGRIKRTDVSQLSTLYKEDKWFLLVMVSEYQIDKVPRFILPTEKDGKFYYVIGNYGYKCLRTLGLKLNQIDKNWRKFKLFTCEETGYLNYRFREELNNLYNERQYLKSVGSKEEKIVKQIAEVLYGKGIQKRDFKGNTDIQNFYSRHDNAYVGMQISFHALQRTHYEIIKMLERLNWSFVACDTDSIKTQNPAAALIFEERNKEIFQENREAGFDTRIGLWKFEGLYPNFIQFGNKVYAYEYEGKINCKFAGCLKNASEAYFNSKSVEEGIKDLMNPELEIPNGIIREYLDLKDNRFYIKKENLAYKVRGGDQNE